MKKPRTQRLLIVSVRFMVRTSVRVAHRCRPWLERAAAAAREAAQSELGGNPSALARSLTRYAILGGATASAFALARSFAGPGVSELLLVVEVAAIGALAVWIAVRLVRQGSGGNLAARNLAPRAKALVIATTRNVAPAHRHLSATRTLQLVCDPRTMLDMVRDPALFGGVFQSFVKKLLLRQASHVLPGLGTARQAMGVVLTGVSSARFIQDFETSARELLAAA